MLRFTHSAIFAVLLMQVLVFAQPFQVLGDETSALDSDVAACEDQTLTPVYRKDVTDFLDRVSDELEKASQERIKDNETADTEKNILSCEKPSICSSAGCAADLKKKINSWKNKGTGYCIGQMQKFFCKHSPWRACNLNARFEVFMQRTKKILEQRQKGAQNPELGISASQEVKQIPLNVLPCIAGIETITLEPLVLPTLRCHADPRRKSDAFGLGQVLSSAAKFMTDDDRFYKFMSNIEPYNQPPYTFEKTVRSRGVSKKVMRSNAKKIYAGMGQSVDLQIELMIELLAQKFRRAPVKRTKAKRRLFAAVRDYNGSENKLNYAKAVMSCKTCLDAGKEPWSCLEKIRPKLGKLHSCVDD